MPPIERTRNLVLDAPVNFNPPAQRGLTGITNPPQNPALYPNANQANAIFARVSEGVRRDQERSTYLPPAPPREDLSRRPTENGLHPSVDGQTPPRPFGCTEQSNFCVDYERTRQSGGGHSSSLRVAGRLPIGEQSSIGAHYERTDNSSGGHSSNVGVRLQAQLTDQLQVEGNARRGGDGTLTGDIMARLRIEF